MPIQDIQEITQILVREPYHQMDLGRGIPIILHPKLTLSPLVLHNVKTVSLQQVTNVTDIVHV